MPDGQVILMNYHGNDQWSAILDQLTPPDLLAILVDEARLTVSSNGLSGRFAGVYWLSPFTTDEERICRASDHAFVLVAPSVIGAWQ